MHAGLCLDTLLASVGDNLPSKTIEEHQQSEEMLHNMFGFKHMPAATDQSATGRYTKLLHQFVTALKQEVSQVVQELRLDGDTIVQDTKFASSPRSWVTFSGPDGA